MIIMFALDIKKDMFFGLNPILAGFLTALITAGFCEELIKYIFFRLALIKNKEVISWLDAIIAAIIVGMGFTLMEDLEFAVAGGSNILRAVFPAHLFFQAVMGYYYGKTRVTGKNIYDVLSLVIPVLLHTFFDMFLIGIIAIVGGDSSNLSGMNPEELFSLPNGEYLIPMLIAGIAAILIVFVAMILMFRKIGIWSKKGEKQEPLKPEGV